MLQIVKSSKPASLIDFKDVKYPLESQTQEIIAYETAAGSGLGILVVDEKTGDHGFSYHKDLVTQGSKRLKFASHTPKLAVKKALDAGRKVLMFKNFEEFLNYSVEYNKL